MEYQRKGRYALATIRKDMRAETLAAKIVKYLAISILGVFAAAVVALFFINDKTIENIAGPLSGPALSFKHGTLDIVQSLGSPMDNGDTNQTPRVVLDIPPAPIPESVAKPVQEMSLSEIAAQTQQEYAMRDETDPIPQNLATANPVSSQPVASSDVINPSQQPTSLSTSSAPPPPPAPASTGPVTEQVTSEDSSNLAGSLETEPSDVTAQGSADPATATDDSELALLESLEQSPSEQVAALPADTTSAGENNESPPEVDPDPTGEQAYAEGLQYYSGEGVERNFGTAAQLFMKASERGHAEAQYSLGLMNYVGQTGGQDFANAAKWFQMAAESGHIQAQYNLGFLYYEGKGVQQDLKTAYGWIDRAAKQGYAKAVKARDALQKAMPEMFGS